MTTPHQLDEAIARLSPDARAMLNLLPTEWLQSGYRRRHIEHRLGWWGTPRFAAARAELEEADLAYHRGGGVYARTLRACVTAAGRAAR